MKGEQMRRLLAMVGISVAIGGLSVAAPLSPAQAATTDSGLCESGSHRDKAFLRDYREFTQSVDITGVSVAEVTTFLSDVRNYKAIHPLIVSVDKTGESTDSDGGTISHYTVTDSMDVAGLPVQFSYTTDMRTCGDGAIGSHAHQTPGIDLYNHTTVTATPAGVTVTEQVHVVAPCLLMGVTYDNGKKAHTEMLNSLKIYFER